VSDVTDIERRPARNIVRPDSPLISIVAPCYNEADAIAPFVTAMMDIIKGGGARYELVFVDDGSTDDTRAQLSALADRHSEIRVIAFAISARKQRSPPGLITPRAMRWW